MRKQLLSTTARILIRRIARVTRFYRRDGADRQQVTTLATGEFIRRFLLHVLPRHCQINANRFQSPGEDGFSGRAELAPLGESGGAVLLEIAAGVEMAFLVEVVMDGRVDGCEFLQTFHLPETKHGSFSSPERLV